MPALRQLVLRLHGVRGQTAAEYLGVLLVVSVIIAALATTDVGHDITARLSELVRDIAGGDLGPGRVRGYRAARCRSGGACLLAAAGLRRRRSGRRAPTRATAH